MNSLGSLQIYLVRRLVAVAIVLLTVAVASGAQQARRIGPTVETGPEMHGTLKAHRYTMVDADLRTDDQACSFSDLTKEVTCVKEGGVDVDILLAPEDVERFYPGLDMNCNGLPGSHPYKTCKFDVVGAALASLPSDAFKIYCSVENLRGLPPTPGAFTIDGVPCDDWNAKNKSVTEEMCQPEDLLTGGNYYPPPCHKRKSAKYDFEKDSTTRVTHCEDRATGQHVNCILGPTGSFNALIPITYRMVTVRSLHGGVEYFVRLEDGQGHVGFYGISEEKKDTPKPNTILK